MKKALLPIRETKETWNRTASLEDALAVFQKRTLAHHHVPLEKCRMEDDRKFVADGQPYDLTDLSARSLLKNLDIPPSFVLKDAPWTWLS